MKKNILILRLAPWSLIEKLIKHIHNIGEYEIHILTQKGIKSDSDILQDIVWHYSTDNKLKRSDIKKVLGFQSFQRIYLTYNETVGLGYYQYEYLLFSLGLSNVYSFNINEAEDSFSWLGLLLYRPFRFFEEDKPHRICFSTFYIFFIKYILPVLIKFVYKKDKGEYDIVFISHFGYHLPSARVRSYNFAKELEKFGLKTKVISMDDDYAVSNENARPTQKFKANLKLAKELSLYGKAIFCSLKPDYHSFAVLAVSKICGNKLIFDQDDWDFHLKIFGFLTEEDAVRQLLKQSSLNITASNALKEETEKRGYKAFYIPTAPDLEKFNPDKQIIDDSKTIFSWIGMIWGKTIVGNLSFIVRCFRETKNMNLHFHFAAGGLYTEYVRRRAERILGERQKLFKWIPPDDIPKFINSTDVGIMPFIGRPDYNKAKSPTKLFEYMACAKPCIVSDVGEMPYIIEHGVNGFLAKTKYEFSEYMNLLAKDKELRKKIGENARKTIEEKYSLTHCAEEFYRCLVNEQLTNKHKLKGLNSSESKENLLIS